MTHDEWKQTAASLFVPRSTEALHNFNADGLNVLYLITPFAGSVAILKFEWEGAEPEPDYEADGDACPYCDCTFTERIDTICDDPLIWVVQCLWCDRCFEVIDHAQ